MQPDELDRLLSDHEIIEPSPGFADAVMTEIDREAATPPRIGFPLRPVLGALAGAALASAAAVTIGLSLPAPIGNAVGRGINELATAGTSTTAASVVLAVAFMLVPMAVYELMMYAQRRPVG